MDAGIASRRDRDWRDRRTSCARASHQRHHPRCLRRGGAFVAADLGRGRDRRDRRLSAAVALSSRHRPMAGQLLRTTGIHVRGAAPLGCPRKRDEGTVLLGAAAAAGGRRVRMAAARPPPLADSRGTRPDRAHLPDRQLVGLAIRRELRASRLRRCVSAACSGARRLVRARRRRTAVAAVVVTLCALSMFQMLQYWHGVLPMSDLTWPQYRSVFLRGWW